MYSNSGFYSFYVDVNLLQIVIIECAMLSRVIYLLYPPVSKRVMLKFKTRLLSHPVLYFLTFPAVYSFSVDVSQLLSLCTVARKNSNLVLFVWSLYVLPVSFSCYGFL